jgi:hypothetical protein
LKGTVKACAQDSVANRPRFGFYSLARIAQLARRQLSYFS